MRKPWLSRALLALLAVLLAGLVAGCGHSSTIPTVEASALPPQARAVLTEIANGGPFEYPGKDGSIFNNYEGLLPQEPGGYYREYTVDTPGSSDRGARRIILGENGELYWTDDHYESFERIEQ